MRKDKTSDWIYLHGLRLRCHIGVTPRERRVRQTIIADIALKCDLRRAGKSDRLRDTVDYSVIAQKISSSATKEKFCLLEALAGRIADICLADLKVKAVTIKVAKKGVLPNVSSVEVEITRSRDFTFCHSRPDPAFAVPRRYALGTEQARESRNSKKTGFPLLRE